MSDVTRRVILVRHGSTAFNADTPGAERIRGWLDVPLAEKGIEQGEAIAAALAKAELHAEQLWTSGLSRAVDTASMIYEASEFPKPVFMSDEGLRPWHVGEWSGREVSAILPLMHQFMFDAPWAEVPGGESFEGFTKRFLTFFRGALMEADKRELTVICATHTRNLRCADAWAEAGFRDDNRLDMTIMWNPKHIEPGGALIFEKNAGVGAAWARRPLDSPASLGRTFLP